jgi:hypothetical protein
MFVATPRISSPHPKMVQIVDDQPSQVDAVLHTGIIPVPKIRLQPLPYLEAHRQGHKSQCDVDHIATPNLAAGIVTGIKWTLICVSPSWYKMISGAQPGQYPGVMVPAVRLVVRKGCQKSACEKTPHVQVQIYPGLHLCLYAPAGICAVDITGQITNKWVTWDDIGFVNHSKHLVVQTLMTLSLVLTMCLPSFVSPHDYTSCCLVMAKISRSDWSKKANS